MPTYDVEDAEVHLLYLFIFYTSTIFLLGYVAGCLVSWII